MKPCDIVSGNPAIPQGETSCLHGEVVYMEARFESDPEDPYAAALVYVAFALLIGFCYWVNKRYG